MDVQQRVAVFGEALVDLLPEPDGRLRAVAGGGPANTAVALARLGISTALIGKVASGHFGDLIRRHLTASGVDVSLLLASALPSTLAVVAAPADPEYAIYTAGTAAFDFTPGDLPALAADVVALHAGSLALFVEPLAASARQLVEREAGRRLISLDPNIRPRAAGEQAAVRERFERLCANADIVRLSAADRDWLYPELGDAGAIDHLLALGPALALLSRGAAGAMAATAEGSADRPAARSAVTDTVGAGDTFNAAVLARCVAEGWTTRAALAGLGPGDLGAVLDFATAAAAITCSRPGADPPWEHELPAPG